MSLYDRVWATAPDDIILYYKLNETTGTTADDNSTEANDGAYSGTITLSSGQSVDNNGCPLFTAGHVNMYSAGFVADFAPAEGSLLVWVKPTQYPTGVAATVAYIQGRTDAGNISRIYIAYRASTEELEVTREVYVNSVPDTKTASMPWPALSQWVGILVTWSETNDEMKLYAQGDLQDTVALAGQTWNDVLFVIGCTFGTERTSNANPFVGYLSDAVIWTSALTPAQAMALTVDNRVIASTVAVDSVVNVATAITASVNVSVVIEPV